jgi:hypothetical protein
VVGEVLVNQWQEHLENPPHTNVRKPVWAVLVLVLKVLPWWAESFSTGVLGFPGNSPFWRYNDIIYHYIILRYNGSQLPLYFPLLCFKPKALGICERKGCWLRAQVNVHKALSQICRAGIEDTCIQMWLPGHGTSRCIQGTV